MTITRESINHILEKKGQEVDVITFKEFIKELTGYSFDEIYGDENDKSNME